MAKGLTGKSATGGTVKTGGGMLAGSKIGASAIKGGPPPKAKTGTSSGIIKNPKAGTS